MKKLRTFSRYWLALLFLGCLISSAVAILVSFTINKYLTTQKITAVTAQIQQYHSEQNEYFRTLNLSLTNIKKDFERLEEYVLLPDEEREESSTKFEQEITLLQSEIQSLSAQLELQRKENAQSNKKKAPERVVTATLPKKEPFPVSPNRTPEIKPIKNPAVTAQFPYELVSIEYRSDKLWGVFAPKNYKNISQFRILSEGDLLSDWKLIHINRAQKSAKFKKGTQELILSINK